MKIIPELTGLLRLINRLQQTGQPLGRQTIVPFAEMKLPRVAPAYEGLVGMLLKENLIQGNAEGFMLTPDGENTVREIS